jgi:hypothetical protein
MEDMTIGPTTNTTAAIPFNLARAYGINPVAQAQPVGRVAPAGQTRPLGRIGGGADEPAGASRADPIDRLVGAIVPGKIDFTEGTPTQRAAALPFYSRPGDLNEAATNIRLGRGLDVEG